MAGDSRMLSAAEVESLIQGVRTYGSKRWSEIQRCYFSDEEHLTIDELKNTWKNLVKMAKNNKRRTEHLPKEIWAQVLEADR